MRAMKKIQAEWRRIPLSTQIDAVSRLKIEFKQRQVAILVAQAPYLETLKMHSIQRLPRLGQDRPSIDGVPIWPLPIVAAAQASTANPSVPVMYSKLQALDIDLQFAYHHNLAYLCCLPRLSLLYIQNFFLCPRNGDEPLPWPVARATPGLHELQLSSGVAPSYIIVHMLRSCKALFTMHPWTTRGWTIDIFLDLVPSNNSKDHGQETFCLQNVNVVHDSLD